MAFGFGGTGDTGLNAVAELLEIETEAVGFHAIAGDAKVQLTQAWPTDALPPPTSSLLAIASKRGLLAAGGPTSVVIASTEAVRKAYEATGNNNIKTFNPELTIDLNTRISQVAFSSDESILAISAEQGGGLAVYEVESLLKGNTQSKLELPTAHTSVRALAPNPGDESSQLFGVVTTTGQLLMADLKAGQLSPPVKDNVSSIAWSKKGKQLVAGLSDGSMVQMTPTGEVKKQIPRPPGLEENQHVSAIAWLENDTFLVVHTPSAQERGVSTYHIVNRDKIGNCEFLKLPEVCGPFGAERYPASQFIQRLKEFPPDLTDVLILTSTASEDVGLFTRSRKPLTSNVDAARITDVYTTTNMANDSRRAQLPMLDDMSNSSPIGMVLDLSSKAKVSRPLPAEEMDESPSPLPAILILNNAGVLAGWWFTYAESIRTGTAYPGLANLGPSQTQTQPSTSAFGSPSTSTQPALGQSVFGSSMESAMGGAMKPATAGFGTTTLGQSNSTNPSGPAFGAPSSLGSAGPTFGTPSVLGGNASTSTSNNVAFGATSGIGPRASAWGGAGNKALFGNASAIGSRPSPWSVAGSGNASTANTSSIFGQTSAATTQTSTFGGNSQPTFGSNTALGSGGGFASFSNTGGFGSVSKGPSIFASQSAGNNFSSNTGSSIFGAPSTSTDNKFGSNPQPSSFFGGKTTTTTTGGLSGGGNFALDNAWKNNTPEQSSQNPQKFSGGSLFGSDFGKILGDTSKEPAQALSEEREMSDEMSASSEKVDSPTTSPTVRETTTPAETPAPSKFVTAPAAGNGLFGFQTQQKPALAVTASGKTASPLSATPTIKTDSPLDLPLPPDATSKATFTPATSSAASTDSAFKATPVPDSLVAKATPSVSSETTGAATPVATESSQQPSATKSFNDAPLPPGFLSTKKKTDDASGAPPLPPDFLPTKSKPNPPTEKSNLFFSSVPDQTEFGSTDEEGEDEDEEEEEEEDGEEDGEHSDVQEEDEGSGVDIGNEIVPTASPKISTESSFGQQGSHLTDGSWANVKMPQQQASQARKGLFGEVHFPPKQPDNERSPSPERRMPLGMLRSESSRSVSAPNLAGRQKPNLSRTMKQAPKQFVSFEQRREEEEQRLANRAAEQRAQEEQALEDVEDETIRRLLASPIEPTTELEAFIAHQDYTATVSKAGVPGQIEKIYRDINSMIDTIGLNCRNIQGFAEGHEEGFKDGRELGDLAESKSWTLAEVQDLDKLETGLHRTLVHARISNAQEQTKAIQRLQYDITKLLTNQKEIRAMAETQFENAANEGQYRDLDLSTAQSNQRKELRAKLKTFQTELTNAESAVAMLRTKLATTKSDPRSNIAPKVPTMEAVGNTVRKMTAKIEERSGDIDVLEARMRKLGMQPSTPSTSRAGSRDGSPALTTPLSAQKHRTSLLLGGGSIDGGSPLRNSWLASTNGHVDSLSFPSPATGGKLFRHRKLTDYTTEDIEPYVKRTQRQKILGGFLRDALVGKDGEKSIQVISVE